MLYVVRKFSYAFLVVYADVDSKNGAAEWRDALLQHVE